MTELHWTAYVTAATPIVLAIFGIVGWFLRQGSERRWKSIEQRWKKEEQLQPDRIEVYDKILAPFILALMSDKAWTHTQSSRKQFRGKSKTDVTTSSILSLDYRNNAFKLMLIGTDEVVEAYNGVMQFFYRRGDAPMTEADTVTALELFGRMILEIRRSVGNEATRLKEWDMLEWFMSDARELQAKHRS